MNSVVGWTIQQPWQLPVRDKIEKSTLLPTPLRMLVTPPPPQKKKRNWMDTNIDKLISELLGRIFKNFKLDDWSAHNFRWIMVSVILGKMRLLKRNMLVTCDIHASTAMVSAMVSCASKPEETTINDKSGHCRLSRHFYCIRAIFVWPWKMNSVNVRYLFYQPMDEKIKTFSRQRKHWRRHCSIGQSCCIWRQS